MDGIYEIIEKQMKTSDRQFDILLKLAGSNRAAIREIITALDRVSGADKKVLRDALTDLEKVDEEILRIADSSAA